MSQGTDSCNTCYGTGEIATENGLTSCPDCYGDGKAASTGNKLEWRLRELEKTYRTNKHEGLSDVMWLVHELRQSRDALLLILTRCQDADDGDEVARYVRVRAMAALGLYPRTPPEEHASRERS